MTIYKLGHRDPTSSLCRTSMPAYAGWVSRCYSGINKTQTCNDIISGIDFVPVLSRRRARLGSTSSTRLVVESQQ